MKAYKPTPAITKLLARFDAELLELLSADLKNYRAKTQFISNNKQVAAQQTLSAAWSTYIYIYLSSTNITYENVEPCKKQGSIFLLYAGCRLLLC